MTVEVTTLRPDTIRDASAWLNGKYYVTESGWKYNFRWWKADDPPSNFQQSTPDDLSPDCVLNEETTVSYRALDLTKGTRYKFCLRIFKAPDEHTGDWLEFTAESVYPYTIETKKAVDITATTATLKADIKLGEEQTTRVQFAYWKTSDETVKWFTSQDDLERDHSDDESDYPEYSAFFPQYSVNISGLDKATEYSYKIVDSGGIDGGTGSFTTNIVHPSVISQSAPSENITFSSAILETVFDAGDFTDFVVSFEYGRDGVSFPNESNKSFVSGTGEISVSIPVLNLSANTLYYFRTKIKYNDRFVYGDVDSFTTLSDEPFVKTLPTTNLWHPSGCATLNAEFHLANQPDLGVWLEYKKTGDTDWITGSETIYMCDGVHSMTVSGIDDGTRYDVRAGMSWRKKI